MLTLPQRRVQSSRTERRPPRIRSRSCRLPACRSTRRRGLLAVASLQPSATGQWSRLANSSSTAGSPWLLKLRLPRLHLRAPASSPYCQLIATAGRPLAGPFLLQAAWRSHPVTLRSSAATGSQPRVASSRSTALVFTRVLFLPAAPPSLLWSPAAVLTRLANSEHFSGLELKAREREVSSGDRDEKCVC